LPPTRPADELPDIACGSAEPWVYLGMWDLHPEMVDAWIGMFPREDSRPTRKTLMSWSRSSHGVCSGRGGKRDESEFVINRVEK
jgi:hypothetical protein